MTPLPNPPDKFIAFNTATMTSSQIAGQLGTLYAEGYTGPIASVLQPDGSTTIFVGGY